MEFRITTTGTLSPVVFNDIGGRQFAHPTTAYNLAAEFSLDEISNSFDIQNAITLGHITVTDEAGQPITDAGGVAGETNTVSNIGTAGVGVYKQKVGVNFELKKLQVASSKLTITDNTGANQVDLDLGLHASTHVTGGSDKVRDATAAQDGLMTLAYASKLDGIAAGATANTKATSAELNTGTDDVKFATALALEGSKYIDQDGSKLYAVATGTNTYVITLTPAPTAYAAGNVYVVKFTNANTGASTINVNSLGAKSIVKGGATALAAGDITAGHTCLLMYDGTNFQIAHFDMPAIHSNVSGEINALTSKVTPTASDLLIIENAAASNSKNKIILGSIGLLGAIPLAYQPAVSDSDTFTTSTTFQTKASLVVAGFTGTGHIIGVAEMYSSIVNHTFGIRVQNTTDAVTVAENVQRLGDAAQVMGFAFEGDVTFTGASKTFEIQYRRDPSDTGSTPDIHIRRARLFFARNA